ncbi:MAG: ABC transporter permease [Firmicutes bacterium]|nr:ABC transporter permease [Bacillota bacterium]
MSNYIFKRVRSAIAVLFVVSIITFLIVKLIPGDPVQFILGTDATPQALADMRAALGLDQPWYVQYFSWLKDILHFNLGRSYIFGEQVSVLIQQRLPVTMSLTLFSMTIVVIFSVILGIISAIKKNSPVDYFSRIIMQLGSALPSFWIGMLLIVYFGLRLRAFPVSGFVPASAGWSAHIHSIVLPGTVLAIAEIGLAIRTVRTSMLGALQEDFMDMARVNGLRNRVIYFKYALRSALVAPVNVWGMQFAKLIGGTAVVETVFALPGLGRLVVVAVEQRDVVLLQGIVMFVTILVILITLAVDIGIMFINPRIRLGTQGE